MQIKLPLQINDNTNENSKNMEKGVYPKMRKFFQDNKLYNHSCFGNFPHFHNISFNSLKCYKNYYSCL